MDGWILDCLLPLRNLFLNLLILLVFSSTLPKRVEKRKSQGIGDYALNFQDDTVQLIAVDRDCKPK
jgi:hypothetical protein